MREERQVQVVVQPEQDWEEVPNTPGIYAWYIDVRATRPDKAKKTPMAFSEDLRRKHASIDPSTRIFLKSDEQFGLRWSAQIKVSSRFTNEPLDQTSDQPRDDKPEEMWRTEDDDDDEISMNQNLEESQAGELAHFLRNAFPYFSAPIYIGTSKHLRTRLREHLRLFKDLQTAQEQGVYSPELEEGASWKKFPSRCALHGLWPTHLLFVYYELGGSIVEPDSEPFRQSRLRAEQFMNLMSRPLFGMR